MRASATSKISSAASYAGVQAKPDANKADGASPFAVMMDTVTSKDAVRDSSRPPQKDKSNTDDKSAKAQDDKTQDSRGAQPSATANSSSKPEKSDKSASKDETKASDDKAGDDKAGDDKDSARQAAASDAQPQDQPAVQQVLVTPGPQTPPPPPPEAQAFVAADDESDDLAVDTAASAALGPQTDIKAAANGKAEAKPGAKTDAPAGTPAKTPVTPAVAAQTPMPTDDSGEEDTDPQIADVAIQGAPAKTAAPVQTKKAADIQTAMAAGDQSVTVQNSDAAKTDDRTPAISQAASQAAPPAPKDAAAKDAAAKSDTTDPVPSGKIGGIKNTGPKAVQTDIAGKDDTAKSDAPKSDAPTTAMPQPDVSAAASAPKAEPHPAPAAIFAVNNIAAPQALSSPVATAAANAHVHVSAEATPDLPSLAISIAGKSQAGAKQFDIRLDPPELGRVEVRLSIDATGKASAHLSADQPQTLNLLQKDAPVLARALREAGLDVSQDGLNFSLRQQGENANGNAGNNGRRGSSRGFPVTASINTDSTAGTAAYRAAANGRLDIRI